MEDVFMTKERKAKITLFHCINAYTEEAAITSDDYELKIIKMPCSGMITDVYMLKAFEAGADAVMILVCPDNACRYMEGNKRATKRVAWTKQILDSIGVGGKRLSIHNVNSGENKKIQDIMQETISVIGELGFNPAA
jgi:coenzyme F420-reducing hydrogenase delta subunit